MARGGDPGKDFDDQWYGSKRRAEYKRDRGEGIWASDKKIERAGQPRPSHHGGSSCAVILISFLGGFAWAFSEIASRVS